MYLEFSFFHRCLLSKKFIYFELRGSIFRRYRTILGLEKIRMITFCIDENRLIEEDKGIRFIVFNKEFEWNI